jgi:shikimate dehydrogenase
MSDHSSYRLAGVMGWPVAHSRSPMIHKHWIKQYRLRGDYVLLPVQPQQLETALRALPALGFAGCNLTIPHKVAALQMVDLVDTLAQRIGAINTVVVQSDGSLKGMNTDAFGYIASLRHAHPQWLAQSGPAVVVGAGGAARAVLAGLLDEGSPQIRLINHNDDKARDMANEFGPLVQCVPWKERHVALSGITLLVNTTSQGMFGESALNLVLDNLPKHALVSDIVYVPAQTPLLVAAQTRGNPTVGGLGMLLHQARLAFNAWFDTMPEITTELVSEISATL